MKILLTTFFVHFQEPLTLYNHLYKWFIEGLDENEIEVKFLMNEYDYQENIKTGYFDILNPILFDKKSVDYIFKDSPNYDFESLFNKIHFEKLTDGEIERLKQVTKGILKDWEPDLIVNEGYIDVKAIWNKIYPNALCLATDNSIFARTPFSRALVFDPVNTTPYNFFNIFEKEIKNFKLSIFEKIQINKFKKDLTSLINKHSIIKDEIKKYKKIFKKTALLPLSGDLSNQLFKDTKFKYDKELTEYVMQNIPNNVGVFVTQSDTIYNLNESDIEYFSKKYKNFIFLQKTNMTGFASNSLYYYNEVDMVFNTLSKTALTANLLYDKPILSLTDNYNNLIADFRDVKQIKQIFKKKKANNKNILYWYLTHYILFEQDIWDKKAHNYFKHMLSEFKTNGITFNLYQKHHSIKEVYNYVYKSAKDNYGYKTYLEKMFDFIKEQKEIIYAKIKNQYAIFQNKLMNKYQTTKIQIRNIIKAVRKIKKYYLIAR